MMDPPSPGWHPASRFVGVDGSDCHYVRLGPEEAQGTPVMLVHGFLMSSFSWRHNLEFLGRDRQVSAPCQVGAGWSQIADISYDLHELSEFLLGLMGKLNIERADLVGHSLGGAVAAWMAHREPDRFRRLVLVNPLVLPRTVPPHPGWLHKSWVSPVLRSALRPTIARLGLQALAYRRVLLDSHYMAGFRAPFQRPGALRPVRRLIQEVPRLTHQVSSVLPSLKQPTLVVWGKRDPLLGSTGGARVTRLIPGARLVTLPDCGHCPHEERPDRFNLLARTFMDEEQAP